MSGFTSTLARALRRGLAVGLVSVVAVLPATALAAQPIVSWHDRVSTSFSDVLCGVAVDVDLTFTDNFSAFEDGTIKGTGSSRAVVTNPLNGESVMLSTAGQFRDVTPVVDEQARTITFLPTITGLPLKIQTQGGAVLLRDAGLISFADTFDLDTGEFISAQTTVTHGPHPEADSEFTKSCDVISGALA